MPRNHQSQTDIHRKNTPPEEALSSESDVGEYLNNDKKQSSDDDPSGLTTYRQPEFEEIPEESI